VASSWQLIPSIFLLLLLSLRVAKETQPNQD